MIFLDFLSATTTKVLKMLVFLGILCLFFSQSFAEAQMSRKNYVFGQWEEPEHLQTAQANTREYTNSTQKHVTHSNPQGFDEEACVRSLCHHTFIH